MRDSSMIVQTPNPNDHKAISPWLDEQIWGHRIWDSQSPWLLFLEFMTVAEACQREGRLFDEQGLFYPLNFKPYKRMYLRNILFNNEVIFQTDEQIPDSDSAWASWLEWMSNKAQAVPNRDFAYLKPRFETFHDFALLIGMLRSSAVESDSNKRWTSRFVFPFGPNALYEDLNISPSGAPTREYINFGRTGELLYLMLCRSEHKEALKPYMEMLLAGNNPWNTLLGLLQPGPDDDRSSRGQSYLPYKCHPLFTDLSEDWLNVFKLQLPGFDSLLHIVTLSALYVLLYQLRVATEWATGERKPFMICEAVAPKKTLVRELSFTNYLANNSLSEKAISAYIDEIEQSQEWKEALDESEAFMKCRDILITRVRWGEDYSGSNSSEALLSELRADALKRHRQHVANVHRTYGRGIGLVSRRGTTKLRYAPTDGLLKTLLIANVDVRMELSEFLDQLYQRYGLIFGEREAEQVLAKEAFDKKAFQANAHRLEQRLSSLGMLRRLSDSCAYVENPYSRRSA